MKRLKIYLDTSVISFLYADDVPEFQQITRSFFEEYVKNNVYTVYISDVVLKEIGKTRTQELRKALLSAVKDYRLRILQLTNESEELASIYINEQIIAQNKIDDARHIAIATCNQMDILLSWNFRHLANYNKQRRVRVVNEEQGYKYPLELTNPMEVFYESE